MVCLEAYVSHPVLAMRAAVRADIAKIWQFMGFKRQAAPDESSPAGRGAIIQL